MSSCEKLRSGIDLVCNEPANKYYQQCVLVNRSDLEAFKILVSQTQIDDSYLCRHRVAFKLFDGKTGYRFTLGESANSIFGTFDKTVIEGIPQYIHAVNIAVLGISESAKCVLSQLDTADYFAALQFYDGTIEIFGFEYGLTTDDYTYDAGNIGGSVIKLRSLAESPEDDLPFIYVSGDINGEIQDFDDDFDDNFFDPDGDYNNDFNNDFNNQ